jgi:hypothetical protein
MLEDSNLIQVLRWLRDMDSNNQDPNLERPVQTCTCPILIIKLQILWLHHSSYIKMDCRARVIRITREVFHKIKSNTLLLKDLVDMFYKPIQI